MEQIFKNSLGIRARLFIGFAAILAVLLISGATVIIKITVAENAAAEVIETNLPIHNATLDLMGQAYASQAATSSWLVTADPIFKTRMAHAWSNIDRLQSTLNSLLTKGASSDDINKWQEVSLLLAELKIAQTKIINAPIIANNATAAKTLETDVISILNKIADLIDGQLTATGERSGGMFDKQYQLLHQGTQDIMSNMNAIRNIEYCLLLLGIVLSMLIAFYTSRSIVQHVNIFRVHSNRIASGDLTKRLTIESGDEMGQLGNDLNIMTEGLSGITKQINQASHSMVTTLEEVRRAVEMQSSGASEQASSINEITASLEEIEKSSAQTMEKAKSLGIVAERTREKGQLGLEAVEQSILGMKTVRDKVQTIAETILELSRQTQQVGEITAVVNNLAQQSKMLALNASIEAAKAGEAGKGFAVVASEVKNLAEQSEQSTTQVQKILEDIRHATEKAVMATEEGTKGVDHGTELVEQTGDVVRSLSDVIHETTIASQQIEAAIRQESIGIEQITAGMNEINQVTSSFVSSVHFHLGESEYN